jgi:hypothetical protein
MVSKHGSWFSHGSTPRAHIFHVYLSRIWCPSMGAGSPMGAHPGPRYSGQNTPPSKIKTPCSSSWGESDLQNLNKYLSDKKKKQFYVCICSAWPAHHDIPFFSILATLRAPVFLGSITHKTRRYSPHPRPFLCACDCLPVIFTIMVQRKSSKKSQFRGKSANQ